MKTLIISQLDSLRIKQIFSTGKSKSLFSGNEGKSLIEEINKAKIVNPKNVPSNVVTMNSIVRIKNVDQQKEYTIQLVYPEFSDPKNGKISILAPIGAAILGYREGDIVDWKIPAGNIKLHIEQIIYQPESAGNYHL